MILKWEFFSIGETSDMDWAALLSSLRMIKVSSNSQANEESDASMAQFGMLLNNWSCFASKSSLGGLRGMALGDRDLLQLPSESRGKNHVQNIDCVPRTVPAWVSKTLTEIRMHSLTHSFIYSSKTMAIHFWAKSCVRVSEMNLQCSKKHNKMYKI